MSRTIPFLTPELNEDIFSAQHLFDEIIPFALSCIADQARKHTTTGEHLKDSSMSAAEFLYRKAAGLLKIGPNLGNGPRQIQCIERALADIATADRNTVYAGKDWEIAKSLGHLAGILQDDYKTREAFARGETPQPTRSARTHLSSTRPTPFDGESTGATE